MAAARIPLEPGVLEHKYYARDLGLVREEAIEGGSGRMEPVARTTE
ncbi:MAG: hypothetical protein QF467_01865 [SAR202 cluster bacterium]|nr:hypothetical protein [SAR202 cluster bacterium]